MRYIYGVIFLLATLVGARAELELNVSQGTIKPTPIAITQFMSAEGGAALGPQITEVITNDLRNCGLFIPLDPASFIQAAASLQQEVHFSEWRLLNADYLVTGAVTTQSDGRVRVEFRLFDVGREVQVEGRAFTASMQDWRRVAHKISDAIYKRVTGDEGYFDTKITYVAREIHGRKRIERIAIMDQDGANHRFVTGGETLVLTPRFSPDMKYITYIDFGTQKKARVYLKNLETGQRILMGNFDGMTFAPRFSPDSTTLVMSYANHGVTSLYDLNLVSHQIRRLTHEPVLDTSPCYSPDGKQIVFSSDRAGQTQLYVMDASGGDPQRISYGAGTYRTPVWSPRGDLIAFTKIYRGSFYIGVMRPDGSDERLLANGFVLESPNWSPNGRLILYTSQDRNSSAKLCVIDITGHHKMDLPTPGKAAHGSWSPLIP